MLLGQSFILPKIEHFLYLKHAIRDFLLVYGPSLAMFWASPNSYLGTRISFLYFFEQILVYHQIMLSEPQSFLQFATQRRVSFEERTIHITPSISLTPIEKGLRDGKALL